MRQEHHPQAVSHAIGLDSTRQFALLLAEPGHQLAEEAEPEEHHADDQHGLHQAHQQGHVGADGEAQHHRHRAGHEADQEEQRAGQPEEEHRLPPEAELEPDREQVEHADRNPRPGELRRPGRARIERHRRRGEPEAVGRRDHHHEAMPVGAHRDVGHHLAAVGLHGVQVGDPDAEEPAAERVVDRGDERLLVLPLLGPGDDVRAALPGSAPRRAGMSSGLYCRSAG